MSPMNERLKRILRIHFDRPQGTPYWLERQEQLGLEVCRRVQTVEDLAVLGPMDEAALAGRPIEDFIPRAFTDCRDYLLAETAGTLGRPKTAVHRADEFEGAFITPFVKAADRVDFPRDRHWLFVGPTGPHIIGRAARRCARALGAGDAFTVDFDPRWAKKLAAGSFAAQRYLNHIEEQALRILEVQNVGVLFATPAVLTGLAEKAAENKRLSIRGIHLGGMHASAEFMDRMNEKFPNAVILSGYGNTLFGMIPQLGYRRDTGFDYYPHGDRLVVRLVPLCEDGGQSDLTARVEYGTRGQVMAHRLDEMQLLVNVLERDTAVRIEPPDGDAAADGFLQDGLRDPRPIVSETIKPVIGLY
jgi:thienamycin biosynthesis protein ThnN